MYHMHPVAKNVDETNCSHISMYPKQIKYLFLLICLQITETPYTTQDVIEADYSSYHDTSAVIRVLAAMTTPYLRHMSSVLTSMSET
jgi:hypothetical protein